MYYLYFNERTQGFTVIPSGVTITEYYDGAKIFQSESKEELIGIAKGFMAARYCNTPHYSWEVVAKAILTTGIVNEKED